MNTVEFPEWMSRAEASHYLARVHGIRRAPNTLRTIAYKGSGKDGIGPRFRKVGKCQVQYSQEDLDAWAERILTQPAELASQHKEVRAAQTAT